MLIMLVTDQGSMLGEFLSELAGQTTEDLHSYRTPSAQHAHPRIFNTCPILEFPYRACL